MDKVWVNGTFDILHLGHIRLLTYASSFGDVCVGLDTDRRIKQLKGENRPYNTLRERTEFLYALKSVKLVTSFDTDEELIEEIKRYSPDIMIIGEDYRDKPIIGSEFIPRIEYFKLVENKSTTHILSYGKNINNRA